VANPTSFVVDANKHLIAKFLPVWSLTVAVTPGGSVTRLPALPEYRDRTPVEVMAQPTAGYIFAGWSGSATGRDNPLALVMTTNLAVTASFKIGETNLPVVVIATPARAQTADEGFTLSGTAVDDTGITSLQWEWNGEQRGALALSNGQFKVGGLKLWRGENRLRVVAMDPSENVAEAEVVVTWMPLRTLQVVTPAEQQEGGKVTVPVALVSQGDVGGMSFRLKYEAEYLKDPWVSWSSLVETSASLVNTNMAGEVGATFSLGGSALPEGTQVVANVTFRARSVPGLLETRLTPVGESVVDAFGDRLVFGTDVAGADVRILPRRVRGDNNANNRLDIGDATLNQRLLARLDPVRHWDVTGNDLNETGDLDDGDVTKMLRTVVGLDVQPALKSENRKPSTEHRGQQLPGEVAAVSGALINEAALLLPGVLPAQAGQTVTAQVVLTNVQGQLAGATFSVTYPADALALTADGCRIGALAPPVGVVTLWNTNQAGKVSLALSGATGWPQVNGVLAELTFWVLPAAAARGPWPLQLAGVEVTPDGYDNRMLPTTGTIVLSPRPKPVTIAVEACEMARESFNLVFASEPGLRYDVEASESLARWQWLRTVSAEGLQTEVRDPTQPSRNQRFYRIISLP
jgi:hypothetical protein